MPNFIAFPLQKNDPYAIKQLQHDDKQPKGTTPHATPGQQQEITTKIKTGHEKRHPENA
ncbi:hypothetical protein [Motiliproteus sp. MSK22-1]|uniref:hypothetical protein n=1 Tax=Motiliproteus sp. MSK22-1 TaxID=1897630 RepID=UPI0013013A1E|nr:hypothetical protein [Motiliproteus sp. MSK22-1]